MTHTATAPHEVRGSLLWDEHGDAPYWGVNSLVETADGGGTYELEIDGEPFTVSLGFKGCGISPRPSDDVAQIREYKIFWETEDELRFGGYLKPRFEAHEFRQAQFDKPFEDRDTINVPKDLGEATAFQIVAGTYREPGYYADMLPRVIEALANELGDVWHRRYLRGDLHPYSTISTFERTVRITRSMAAKIHRNDGILERLFQLLSHVEGSYSSRVADNREIVAHRHTNEHDQRAMRELPFNFIAPGVSIKIYHPEYPRKDSSDPLYHPRLGVLFKKGKSNRINKGGRPFHDRRELSRQLEEILMNILEWADIPVEPGPTFVPDRYWDVEPSHRNIAFYADPTPEIRRTQDSNFLRVLAQASNGDTDHLRTLVTDGGQMHYQELADVLDVATSTVYRWLERCSGLLESDDGVIKFISERQRQRALEVLRPIEEEANARAHALASILDMNPRTLERKGSAFQQWIAKYAAELVEDGDGNPQKLKIQSTLTRLGSLESYYDRVSDAVEEGYAAWRDAGLDRETFLDLVIEYSDETGERRATKAGAALR